MKQLIISGTMLLGLVAFPALADDTVSRAASAQMPVTQTAPAAAHSARALRIFRDLAREENGNASVPRQNLQLLTFSAKYAAPME